MLDAEVGYIIHAPLHTRGHCNWPRPQQWSCMQQPTWPRSVQHACRCCLCWWDLCSTCVCWLVQFAAGCSCLAQLHSVQHSCRNYTGHWQVAGNQKDTDACPQPTCAEGLCAPGLVAAALSRHQAHGYVLRQRLHEVHIHASNLQQPTKSSPR